jgi:hypothetical protein
MAIDTGKILNVSISEYTGSNGNAPGKCPQDYDLVGVHYDGKSIVDFAAKVPNDAEVVVNYQRQMFGMSTGGNMIPNFQYYQMGVALVPKKK